MTYDYRSDDKRMSRAYGGSTIEYHYNAGFNVIAEHNGSDTLLRTYIYDHPLGLIGRLLGDVGGTNPPTGSYRYYFQDHLGSTRRVRNHSRVVLSTYEYTPYGEVYSQSGTDMEYTFTGKHFDSQTGLYLFPYRSLNPQQSRWTTRDPMNMTDGPNVYAYVKGNPVGHNDPLGTYMVKITKGWEVSTDSPKPPSDIFPPFMDRVADWEFDDLELDTDYQAYHECMRAKLGGNTAEWTWWLTEGFEFTLSAIALIAFVAYAAPSGEEVVVTVGAGAAARKIVLANEYVIYWSRGAALYTIATLTGEDVDRLRYISFECIDKNTTIVWTWKTVVEEERWVPLSSMGF